MSSVITDDFNVSYNCISKFKKKEHVDRCLGSDCWKEDAGLVDHIMKEPKISALMLRVIWTKKYIWIC